MKPVYADFSTNAGAVKPMHAVNNGPCHKFAVDQRISNLDSYREAGIPFARTHDASFHATYGGEHTVDVVAIFPDFSRDPYDPASYDFQLTDEYLQIIELGGAEVFYRLGNKIEHWSRKYGTLPPPDHHKWAVICEHIIRHYTEGWADGFHMNIRYWEIWNEPDLDADDSTHKRCWGGTKQEFFDFYAVAARHLKACFPHLKIGGPALAHDLNWARDFLTQLDAPLDFFSWHIYARDPHDVGEKVLAVHRLLNETGYGHVESILNEWNYVRSFEGEDWVYSLRAEKSLKGAAFVASTMSLCQQLPVDMLMYYDARPCAMNGLFSTDLVCDKLKGYYPFVMFDRLYRMGQAVACGSGDSDIYLCAARDGGSAGLTVSHYNDDETTPGKTVCVDVRGLGFAGGVRARYWLLDESHDMQPVREECFTGDAFTLMLTLPVYSCCYVSFTALSEEA